MSSAARAAQPRLTCRWCGVDIIQQRPIRRRQMYCDRRCANKWFNRMRPGRFLHTSDLVAAPANDTQAPTRWRIVRDLEPIDGEDMALCVCAHGHEQAVAIDIVPAPDCDKCEEGIAELPELKRLTRVYYRRLPESMGKRSCPTRSRYNRRSAAAVCAAMHLGMSMCEACRALNISFWCAYHWYRRGRDRTPGFKKGFYVAVEDARRARRCRRGRFS